MKECFEDIEAIIDEWFADYDAEDGKVGVAKLYAEIHRIAEKNLIFIKFCAFSKFFLANKNTPFFTLFL